MDEATLPGYFSNSSTIRTALRSSLFYSIHKSKMIDSDLITWLNNQDSTGVYEEIQNLVDGLDRFTADCLRFGPNLDANQRAYQCPMVSHRLIRGWKPVGGGGQLPWRHLGFHKFGAKSLSVNRYFALLHSPTNQRDGQM